MAEEESGSVILLYCHRDPTMQDDCRGPGPESAPQHRETKEGLGEAALGPAALSMEVTPHHVNLAWIPASAAQPCGLFPPRDPHFSWVASSVPTSLLCSLRPRGGEWPAHRAVTPTRSLLQPCAFGVSHHTAGGEALERSVVYKAERRHASSSADLQPIK